MTNVGILVGNVDAKDVDSNVYLFNEEKEGAKYESNDIPDLFSRLSKQISEWSHDIPTNDIDNGNPTNHSNNVFVLKLKKTACTMICG